MKIIFMGTPDFARISLNKLYDAGHEILAVVTPPDRPKGRGMKMIACDVKEYAVQKGFKIFQPEKLSEIKVDIDELNPDMIVVVSYGKFLPSSILSIPRYGCVNVHPSLLPKYRGSAPIQWAIINGDKITGTTIMKMNEKMDAGDIILQKEVEIAPDVTTGELWEKLAEISGNLLIEAVRKIEFEEVIFTKQPEEYTLAPMITKDMAKIDWSKSSVELKNLVRGLNPILGAYAILGQKKFKFWKIDIVDLDNNLDGNFEPGNVIMVDNKKGLIIKTVDGAISILEIQGENAKKMSIFDFLRGNQIEIGEKFV